MNCSQYVKTRKNNIYVLRVSMSDQQVAQLFELFKEMQKPRDPNDPLGVSEHPLATDLKDS